MLEAAEVGFSEVPTERTLECRVRCQLDDERCPGECGADAASAQHPGRVDDIRGLRESAKESDADDVAKPERNAP
jgi:hypothetical protein